MHGFLLRPNAASLQRCEKPALQTLEDKARINHRCQPSQIALPEPSPLVGDVPLPHTVAGGSRSFGDSCSPRVPARAPKLFRPCDTSDAQIPWHPGAISCRTTPRSTTSQVSETSLPPRRIPALSPSARTPRKSTPSASTPDR